MIHPHNIYDTDQHFIVDPITRRITSESGKVTLMQNDHHAERFTFELPRYMEGHDMSLSEVQVHYLNHDSKNKTAFNADVYPITDLQVSPDSDDVVIGSWLISHNATKFVGSLHFALRFVCYEGEDIVYQWFSDVYTGIKVAESIYNVDVLVDEYDMDLLEAWKRQILEGIRESDVYRSMEGFRDEAVKASDNAQIAASDAIAAATEALEHKNITIQFAGDANDAATAAAGSASLARASEVNAQTAQTVAMAYAQEVQANTDIAVTSAETATTSAAAVENIKAENLEILNEATSILSETTKVITGTDFAVNYETGYLECSSTNYKFSINPESGNLEMEVVQ